MTIVLGHGRTPNRVMLVGESPGAEEAAQGVPFVGKSGQEQEWYFSHNNINPRSFYKTNVVKRYIPGNPDPTSDQIARWTPELEREIDACDPQLILAVGRFAARWFLGPCSMDYVHGIPHRPGAFDSSLSDRSPCPVIPVYHPAFGFYQDRMRGIIDYDYRMASGLIKRIKRGDPLRLEDITIYREDEPEYIDLSDEFDTDKYQEFSYRGNSYDPIAIDTEGTPDDPWCIQYSIAPGKSVVVLCSGSEFKDHIDYLQNCVDNGASIIFHNAMYDIEMCTEMGLDLSDAKISDSMISAYLLGVEPKGLKPLAWRHARLKMNSYMDVVGKGSRDEHIRYLTKVAKGDWPKPEKRTIVENDGTERLYGPQSIQQKARGVLRDIAVDKRDKEGNPVDPVDRWHKTNIKVHKDEDTGIYLPWNVTQELIDPVEKDLGPFPTPSLQDADYTEAVHYSARDADATYQVAQSLDAKIKEQGLEDLLERSLAVLPVFEEMQRNGFPASRVFFESFYDELTTSMLEITNKISRDYFNSRSFNPNSSKNVRTLMLKRGIRGTKKTKKTRQMSTSKDSIKKFEHEDEAIADIFEWRSVQHIRDSFVKPILSRIPEGEDLHPIRCRLNPTGTTSRRLASSDPNLLNIPSRTKIGLRVREGFMALPGMVLLSCDLSQIEVRVAAHVSRDRVLRRVINSGEDIHTNTAAMIFEIPVEEVTKEQRAVAKSITFGVIYGMSAARLENELKTEGIFGWDQYRCQETIDKWFEVYYGVKEYEERVRKFVEKHYYIEDHWKHRRYLPGIDHPDEKVRAETLRQAVNHTIQSGAQGMLQNSMIYLKPIIKTMRTSGIDVRWILQVHDEVILMIEEDKADLLESIVRNALENHHGFDGFSVDVKAESSIGRNWGELK